MRRLSRVLRHASARHPVRAACGVRPFRRADRRPDVLQDHYKILGVERDATIVEIKAAFKKLAMSHHPDKVRPRPCHPSRARTRGQKLKPGSKQGGDEEKFKELRASYEILSDERRRQRYDEDSVRTSSVSLRACTACDSLLSSNRAAFRRTGRRRRLPVPVPLGNGRRRRRHVWRRLPLLLLRLPLQRRSRAQGGWRGRDRREGRARRGEGRRGERKGEGPVSA